MSLASWKRLTRQGLHLMAVMAVAATAATHTTTNTVKIRRFNIRFMEEYYVRTANDGMRNVHPSVGGHNAGAARFLSGAM